MPANATSGKYFVGQKFNHWTLLETPLNTRHQILLRCDCGDECRAKFQHVLSGASTQCRSCKTRQLSTKHGATSRRGKSHLYRTWGAMKRRCSPQEKDEETRKLYYERGIRVCDEWLNSFTAFRDWSLANGYRRDLQIDRKDNDKVYSPANCRWATTGLQARNQRRRKYYFTFGGSKVAADWSADPRCAVSFRGLVDRFQKGWPPELAITTPAAVIRLKENQALYDTINSAAHSLSN